MKIQGKVSRDNAIDLSQPEWHPYRVWQNQIRSQQPDKVVGPKGGDPDNSDNTGTWKATIGNA